MQLVIFTLCRVSVAFVRLKVGLDASLQQMITATMLSMVSNIVYRLLELISYCLVWENMLLGVFPHCACTACIMPTHSPRSTITLLIR
jgi:hypothetical protein